MISILGHLRISLVIPVGAWLVLAPPVFAQRPSDFELQAAHCLGIYSAMIESLEQDVLSDCASNASPIFGKYCETDRKGAITAKQTFKRLGDYLKAKKLPFMDPSVQLATRQGRSDYAATMGADHDCVRGLPTCGDLPQDALERLNRCPATIKALPF